jgi:hypothetical protein
MSTLNCTYIQSKAASTPVTFQDLNGNEIGQLCRAWVNFNGTTASPSTIRASFNVSSVTKNGTGDYTVNFTTALTDANYAVTGALGDYNTGNSARAIATSSLTAPTSSAVRIHPLVGSAEDQIRMCIVIFR